MPSFIIISVLYNSYVEDMILHHFLQKIKHSLSIHIILTLLTPFYIYEGILLKIVNPLTIRPLTVVQGGNHE